MIKVENVEVFNFEGAIRGLRNPLNSWDKSDSRGSGHYINGEFSFDLGENDLSLMKRLYRAGTEHRKYLRQIFVSMDIVAPLYWIAEFDTYKVGVTRNSCSFMHRGTYKPFEISDFSIHDDRVYEVLSPLSEKVYPLTYAYDTTEYKLYVCNNGRQYKVYRNGRVVSCEFEYIDTYGRHRTFSERECKPSRTRGGYYELHLGGRSGERWLLHRLVATVWLSNKWLSDNDDSLTVNHIDGNKGNNCIENLEWVTLSDNIRKGFDEGLYENCKSLHTKYLKWKNGHIVVNPLIKSQILRDRQNGLTCKQLAEKYDITVTQVNNMISIPSTEDNELFILCYTWETIIDTLNSLREEYLDTHDNSIFQQIRCLLPSGYNQRFTITMNYENVMTIINQRTGHKLDDWNDFVKILHSLPYVDDIRGEVNG